MFGMKGIIGGIVLIIIGIFFVFIFPGASSYQPEKFSIVAILLGLILIITGVILIFIP